MSTFRTTRGTSDVRRLDDSVYGSADVLHQTSILVRKRPWLSQSQSAEPRDLRMNIEEKETRSGHRPLFSCDHRTPGSAGQYEPQTLPAGLMSGPAELPGKKEYCIEFEMLEPMIS